MVLNIRDMELIVHRPNFNCTTDILNLAENNYINYGYQGSGSQAFLNKSINGKYADIITGAEYSKYK